MLNNLQIKIAKSFRKVFSKIPLTNFFEKKIENKFYIENLNTPPIFIVGAPRSGTTMLYQLLLKEFKLFYFSNVSNVFYDSPLLINYLIKNKINKVNITLQSNSGYVKGFFSPSEIGVLNEKWFENKNNIQQTRSLFKTLSNFYNRPIVVKNTFNTLRIDNIKQVFPNALILYITRNPFFNAQSIILNQNGYKAIDRLHNKISLSDKNSTIFTKSVKLLLHYHTIKTQIAEKYPNSVIEIAYENLCVNPKLYMDKIHNWFLDKNFSIDRKNIIKHIDITIKKEVKLDKADEKQLNLLIEQFFNG